MALVFKLQAENPIMLWINDLHCGLNLDLFVWICQQFLFAMDPQAHKQLPLDSFYTTALSRQIWSHKASFLYDICLYVMLVMTDKKWDFCLLHKIVTEGWRIQEKSIWQAGVTWQLCIGSYLSKLLTGDPKVLSPCRLMVPAVWPRSGP